MVIVITQEALDRLIQIYVDRVADEAIGEAVAYSEIQELRRIAEL